MASTSHQSAMRSFMVQTVCDKPLEQCRHDINIESTFYDAFLLSDWSNDYLLVRVEPSSSIRADSLPFTVGNVYIVIKDEVDALKQLGECVSAVRFVVKKDADEPNGRGLRASGSAFDVLLASSRRASELKMILQEMVGPWLIQDSNKGKVSHHGRLHHRL